MSFTSDETSIVSLSLVWICLRKRSISSKESLNAFWQQLDHDDHMIESVVVIDLDTIVRAHAFDASQDVFYLRREYVRSADDEHVVGAGANLLHTRMSTPACAWFGDHIAQVVRAITQDGERLLVERREHQLAGTPSGSGSPVFGSTISQKK